MKQLIKAIELFCYLNILLLSKFTFGQYGYANNWHFGSNAGITFQSGQAALADTSGADADQGCISFSDKNGNLLFYSNGIGSTFSSGYIKNANHDVMPNGNIQNITGNGASVQSSLVIPIPGSDHEYYMFTIDDIAPNNSNPTYKGLTYTIIDMSLDNGLGEVISAGVQMFAPATPFLAEGISGTKHANGVDYWLIVHEGEIVTSSTFNSTNKFIIYLITENGISASRTQNIGRMDLYPGHSIKVSVQGDKISYGYEIFDFDNQTGIISNAYYLGGVGYCHNAFSRSGRYLYLLPYGSSSVIKKYDLFSNNITNSGINLPGSSGSQMQLGPDSKIYIARAFKNQLGVINDPDNLSGSANYTLSNVNFGSNYSVSGLPNFVDSDLFDPKTRTDSIVACEQYTWIDGNTYVESNNTAIFLKQNQNGYDSIIKLDLTIRNVDFEIGVSVDSLIVFADSANYQWLNCEDFFNPITNEINNVFKPIKSGFYAVEIRQNECIDTSNCIEFVKEVELLMDTTLNCETIQCDSLLVYPNPTEGNLNIVQSTDILCDLTIEIYDAKGSIVCEQKIVNAENLISLDLNNLRIGAYFLQIYSKSQHCIKQIEIK